MKDKIIALAREHYLSRLALERLYPILRPDRKRVMVELDNLIARLRENVVEDVTLRVAEFDGDFVMSPRSHLFMRIIRYGVYEPQWSGAFLSFIKPGMDVIDIGANVGFYTVAAAKRGARVLSIEPTAGAFRRLRENVRRNGVEDRVVLFRGGITDHDGETSLHVVEGMEEYSSINPIHSAYVVGEQTVIDTVPARTLDSLVEEFGFRPSVIKSDTEGAELLVFRGAQKTLATHRPVVMSELSDTLLARFGAKGDDVAKLFMNLGYTVQSPSGQRVSKGADGYGEIMCLP